MQDVRTPRSDGRARSPEEVRPALEHLRIPSFIFDRNGRVRWANAAAREILGSDCVGRVAQDFVAPEHKQLSREMIQKKLLTAKPTDFELNLIDSDGRRTRIAVSSAPLEEDGAIAGVFGLFTVVRDPEETTPLPSSWRLTSRQVEMLTLLAEGASTSDIAEHFGLSEHTVRNHIREILARLRTHSRISAVAIARKHGLV